jgi:hypothetical protein
LRYAITDADVVTRLAETLAKLETSFPLAARGAIAEFREQVLHASVGPEIHGFDRKLPSNLWGIYTRRS